MGAFIYDVRCFLSIFEVCNYPNQMVYYIGLFSKIRCSLTYLPKNLTSYLNAPYVCLTPLIFSHYFLRQKSTRLKIH